MNKPSPKTSAESAWRQASPSPPPPKRLISPRAPSPKSKPPKSHPPISTLLRIAEALGVPLVDFFADQAPPPRYVFTPKNARQIVSHQGSKFGYCYEALALDKPDKYVEPFLLTIKPDDPPGQFHHKGQEFLFMLSGAMDFTIDQDVLRMKPGRRSLFRLRHRTQNQNRWQQARKIPRRLHPRKNPQMQPSLSRPDAPHPQTVTEPKA